MSEPLRIFIGWDSKEPAAFHVLVQSILRHTTVPVAITPLTQHVLRRAGIYTRARGATESTEFSLTRFLVPHLCGYQGTALFLDCDMLAQSDLTELWAYPLAWPEVSVHVVKHEYVPREGVKFLGHVNTVYPKKNWSSVMLFNNARCTALTPAYVNEATGLDLHRFHWTDEASVGALPLEFNWLVGEYPPNAEAKILHYTLGGPWFADYATCDHADLWCAERDRMLGLQPVGGR